MRPQRYRGTSVDDVELNSSDVGLTLLGTNCTLVMRVHGSMLLYVHRNHKAH